MLPGAALSFLHLVSRKISAGIVTPHEYFPSRLLPVMETLPTATFICLISSMHYDIYPLSQAVRQVTNRKYCAKCNWDAKRSKRRSKTGIRSRDERTGDEA